MYIRRVQHVFLVGYVHHGPSNDVLPLHSLPLSNCSSCESRCYGTFHRHVHRHDYHLPSTDVLLLRILLQLSRSSHVSRCYGTFHQHAHHHDRHDHVHQLLLEQLAQYQYLLSLSSNVDHVQTQSGRVEHKSPYPLFQLC